MPIRQGALRSVIIRASKKAVERDAKIVVARAKVLAPRDTGNLANSITYSLGQGANGMYRANIYAKAAPYAEGVEKGTGIYGPSGRPISSATGKVMVFKVNGRTVRAKTVKGQRPQPFLKPALRSLRER